MYFPQQSLVKTGSAHGPQYQCGIKASAEQ